MDLTQILKDKVEEIDIKDLVREEVKQLVSLNVRESIRDVVKKEIEIIIQDEIKSVMRKPIKTDDGWGEKNEYPDFEALFKIEFAKRLDASWEMKNTIERAVKDRVSSLMDQNMKEVVEKFVNLVSGTVLKTETKL